MSILVTDVAPISRIVPSMEQILNIFWLAEHRKGGCLVICSGHRVLQHQLFISPPEKYVLREKTMYVIDSVISLTCGVTFLSGSCCFIRETILKTEITMLKFEALAIELHREYM